MNLVSASNYLLSTASLYFAANSTSPFSGFFATIAFASALGGIYHDNPAKFRGMWKATMLALGATAYYAWRIALASSPALPNHPHIAVAIIAIYSIYVLFVDDDFSIAMAVYLPAAIILLYSSIIAQNWRMVAGIVLFIVAAMIQSGQLVSGDVDTRNTLYHLVQLAALSLVYSSTH